VTSFVKNRWEDDVKSNITNIKITNWKDCNRNRPKWKELEGLQQKPAQMERIVRTATETGPNGKNSLRRPKLL
jgi:hypothetical protein